jgi:hypothetical protein
MRESAGPGWRLPSIMAIVVGMMLGSCRPESGASISFATLDKGSLSGAVPQDGERLVVVRDQTTWESFWSKHRYQGVRPSPSSRPPVVDFRRKQVIGVIAAGVSEVTITQIRRGDDAVFVHVENARQEGCQGTTEVLYPYHLVTTTNTTEPVELRTATKLKRC